MKSPISSPVLQMQDDLLVARRLSLLGAAGASCLLLLLFVPDSSITWPHLLLVALYLGRKGYRYVRGRRLARRLRLESLFVAHCPDASQVRRCRNLQSHLWRRSLTLRCLHTLAERTPLATLDHDEAEFVTRTYEHTLAPLRLPPFNLDLLLLAGVTLAWVGALPLEVSVPYVAASFFTALLLAADVHLAIVQIRQRHHFGTMLEALTAWTLSDHAELLTPPERSYQHTLLYRAPRWFQHYSSPVPAEPAPLRRVA